MKKAKWAVLAVVLIIAALAVLTFILWPKDEAARYRSNLSEVRSDILSGESEHFEVAVFIGERENPYKLDGVANPMQSYYLVTVYPKFELNYGDAVNATVMIGDKKYTKALTPHPYNGSYSADFNKLSADTNVSVNVTAKEFDEDVSVLSMLTESMLSSEAAFKKGMELLKSSVESTISADDGKYKCEIHVVLVNSFKQEDGKLYWHVYVYDTGGEEYAVMLEADSASLEVENPGGAT